MKRLFTLLAILTLFTVIACKKEGGKYGYQLKQSNATWQEFKLETGNSYMYEVVRSSWVGYGYYTIITVKAGKVTERKYILKGDTTGSGAVTVLREWTEDESQVGSHTSDGAAPAVTLDVIYGRARNEWLNGPDDANYIFETKNDGMISTCGHIPRGCADDCFRGIHISYIRPL